MGLAGGAQPRNQLQIPLTPNSMSKHSWEGKILPLFFITARYGLVLVPYSPHPNLASLALWKTRLKSVCRTKLIYSMSTHAPPKGSLAVSAVWGLYHMVVVRATKGYGSKRQWDEWTAVPWVDERPIHYWPLSWHVRGTNGPGVTVTILTDLWRKDSGLF